jgi:hypothetical protein
MSGVRVWRRLIPRFLSAEVPMLKNIALALGLILIALFMASDFSAPPAGPSWIALRAPH